MLASNTILRSRYRILQQLGRGGMGAVYQAMDETLSCLVAVKETFATSEEERRAFEREAKLLANLSHPALPRVMDHFTDGEGQFLVMQFIPGNDLAELLALRERPFEPAKALEWADYLLDALEELHSYRPPIIHRDIKPSNLKLTPRGRIILLDFGIAKGAAGQMTTVETDGSLGAYTPNYAPLEQAVRSDKRWVDVLSISNEEAVKEILLRGTDPRADLYALAATLYHLMTGEIPPDAPTRALSVWYGKPDRLRLATQINSEIPLAIANVLQQAMALDRDERPASAIEMRKSLRAAAQTESPAIPIEIVKDTEAEDSPQLSDKNAGTPKRRPAGEPLADQNPQPTEEVNESAPSSIPQAPIIDQTRMSGTIPSPTQVNETDPQRAGKTIPAQFTPARLPSDDAKINVTPAGTNTKAIPVWLIAVGLLTLIAVVTIALLMPVPSPVDVSSSVDDTSVNSYVPTGAEGSISGTITYNGVAPEVKMIDTSADPACTSANPNLTSEDWVVKDGKLANTYVYIKEGTLADGSKVGDYSTWPNMPASATLDQNGCHYKPHVLGVVVNEPITITNSDKTTHNIHFTPKNNPDWNQQQSNGTAAMTHKLARAEVLVPVKCNQHPWMKAYIGVTKNPFFAVSADDGSFTIKSVPPGKYTLVAWHEGGANGIEKVVEVTIPAKGIATANFSFGATALGQPSSLRMMSALEFPMLGKH